MEEKISTFGTKHVLHNYDAMYDSSVDKMLFCQRYVAKLVSSGLSNLEALSMFCKNYDIDEEEILPYISNSLRSKLYDESLDLHLIKKSIDNEFRYF